MVLNQSLLSLCQERRMVPPQL